MSAAIDDRSPGPDSPDRAGLARSSAAVAAGTLLSRLTGLLRVVVLAAAIGKASLSDTYNLANLTPNIVYELLVGGVLAATLVPVFVDLARTQGGPLDIRGLHGDDDRARDLHRRS